MARLYDVEVKVLNQAAKRNSSRFPDDFMFQLTEAEAESLRSQFVTLYGVVMGGPAVARPVRGRGRHPKYRPYAFTEQGVAMLSSVLHSNCAVMVNVEIMRTFVRLRAMLASNAELSKKLHTLEAKYDKQFKVVLEYPAIGHVAAILAGGPGALWASQAPRPFSVASTSIFTKFRPFSSSGLVIKCAAAVPCFADRVWCAA